MFKKISNKIKFLKKILELKKEIEKITNENEETILELRQLFETAKILFPSLVEVLNDIIKLVKSDNNKKVWV